MSQRIVAITGGNSGIGLACTNLFLQEGYKVAVFGQSAETLRALHTSNPENILVHAGDIAKPEDIEAFYAKCAARWQRLDVVIANAGSAIAENIDAVTETSFAKTMDINVKGVFFTVQSALPYLNNHASVILMSSIQAHKGAGIWAVYGASKAAVRSLARSFADALGSKGIRVNTLSPGVTRTPIFGKFGFSDDELDNIIKHVEEQTPLGRIGQPEEIAKAALFLASDASSFMTGSDLQVDGGLTQT